MAKNKVNVNYPSKPKDALFEVPGLGVFPNGTYTEVSDDDVRRFKNYHGPGTREFPKDGNLWLGEKTSKKLKKNQADEEELVDTFEEQSTTTPAEVNAGTSNEEGEK